MDRVCREVLQRTPRGEPYLLDERAHRLLSVYQRDYRVIIPADAFLVLGNLSSGSLDSTRYGLVGRKEVIGKAIATRRAAAPRPR